MNATETNRAELVADTQRALQNLIWNGRQRFQEMLREYGLTVPQAQFLLHLDRRGPEMSMGEATDALQLTASTTTSIADRLVERSLIERGINPDDRRVVVASLTTEGQALVEEIKTSRSKSFARLLNELTDDEVARFRDTVEQIVSAMDNDALAHGSPKN